MPSKYANVIVVTPYLKKVKTYMPAIQTHYLTLEFDGDTK